MDIGCHLHKLTMICLVHGCQGLLDPAVFAHHKVGALLSSNKLFLLSGAQLKNKYRSSRNLSGGS